MAKIDGKIQEKRGFILRAGLAQRHGKGRGFHLKIRNRSQERKDEKVCLRRQGFAQRESEDRRKGVERELGSWPFNCRYTSLRFSGGRQESRKQMGTGEGEGW